MDSTVGAFVRGFYRMPIIAIADVIPWVWNVYLWDCGEVYNCVCDGVTTAEGNDDTLLSWEMREGDVTAGI